MAIPLPAFATAGDLIHVYNQAGNHNDIFHSLPLKDMTIIRENYSISSFQMWLFIISSVNLSFLGWPIIVLALCVV